MKGFKEDIKSIYQGERGGLVLMIFNFLLSVGLFIFSVAKINPESALIKVGYGDIGGYRDGTWTGMIAFPILAILFGILHNLLALRIFNKRGAGMMKFFLVATSMLIFGTFLVLIRLSSEG